MDSLERLTHCMREKTPVLVLGAGFSYGAINSDKIKLPLGSSLTKSLYEYFYVNNPLPDTVQEELEEIKNYDLRKICTVLRSEERQDERNQFITRTFSGCQPGEVPFQEQIINYSWKYIFTLNVDDLVENIYRNKGYSLNIWNRSNNGYVGKKDSPKLIKLHGCVNDSSEGYVFDDTEYADIAAKQDCLYREFSHAYLRNDVILLGTEFEENDLQIAINIYKESGYSNSGNHYFFVTPSINSIVIKNFIKTNPDFTWIKMTTQEFLEYITKNISDPINSRARLKEQGAVFLDEVHREPNYKSAIYNGAEPTYMDFFESWDIRYPNMDKNVQDFIQSGKSGMLAIHGKSYVGKTSVAKRALNDFYNNKFVALELIRGSNGVYSELKNYLKTLPKGSKVTLLVEDAAYQYITLIRFLEQCPTNISQLVLITVDITENHVSKYYILKENIGKNIKSVNVSESISWNYSENIFQKLYEKNRLNKLLNKIPSRAEPAEPKYRNKIKNYMKKTDDLIEVLHYSSEGRGFHEYYSTWLDEHHHKHFNEYLKAICVLGELGITWIPNQILPHIVPDKRKHFSLNRFAEQYPEIVHIYMGRTRLRRRRILHPAIGKNDSSINIDALYQVAINSLGLFKEGLDNEYSEIFQKALRIKKIRNKSLLTQEQMYDLLSSLEEKCKGISYYWVQYGITCQLDSRFEDANNHFLYAQRLQPKSYQVKHALAKNWMERGLHGQLNRLTSAEQHFENGQREMRNLIDSDFYKDAFHYSVHSYVNLLLKYYNQKDEVIPRDECEYVQGNLKLIVTSKIDSRLKDITIQFIQYCKKNNLDEYINGLEIINSITPIVTWDDDIDINHIDIGLEQI